MYVMSNTIESHQIITNVQKLAIVMYRCYFLATDPIPIHTFRA